MAGGGKTILVTGSTDGIGRQAAIDLLKLGAHVIIHARNEQRAIKAIEFIKNHAGLDGIEAAIADLSSLEQIRGMAARIRKEHGHLDVLLNNAGVYQNRRTTTVDGYETTFAVNHLAPFLLTLLLLDMIKKSGSGRIVNVASQAHASSLDFDNLQGEKSYSAYQAYAGSKLCNIMFTYMLADLLEGRDISVNCLHPGVIDTKLLRAGFGGGAPVSEGSRRLVFCAISPECEGLTGRYFVDCREVKSSTISYDKKAQIRLWEMSERMTGICWSDVKSDL